MARGPSGKADPNLRPARGRVLNRSDAADMFGVSAPTITNWVKQGAPYVQAGRKGREWLFNSADMSDWLQERAVAQQVGDNEKWDIDEAKRRKEAADAALREIELAKARGLIVDVEAVADIVGDDYSRVRARLLSLPPKVAPLCHRAESVQEIRETLDAGIHEALAELSSIDGALADGAGDDEGAEAEAASETDGQ